ncbi:hypothetical protein [Frondihabitans sp. VKM Ac-2883]|uniref:hypothetical protein n=1 Tax=Frondihabitans sp. VKM Ac-2883 TaxID=2783823 RepID=UPI00188CCF1D|nr:hypothetical protein [Frondihabitans sp. VKM Ac-2883]MBF4576501.1 hypothetical protein [Frondihabitans sp. VKM Ac-2883]
MAPASTNETTRIRGNPDLWRAAGRPGAVEARPAPAESSTTARAAQTFKTA